jgi:hypothetical protein
VVATEVVQLIVAVWFAPGVAVTPEIVGGPGRVVKLYVAE